MIALDEDKHTIVRTEWAVAEWERAGYEAFAQTCEDGTVPFFAPERGTEQVAVDAFMPSYGYLPLRSANGIGAGPQRIRSANFGFNLKMGIKAVESYDAGFELSPEARRMPYLLCW